MPGPGRKFPKKEVIAGPFRYDSMAEAARSHGISPQLFGRRMAKGLTAAQALGIEPPPDWFVPGKGQLARELGRRRLRQEQETGCRKCSKCKQLKPLKEFFNRQPKEGAGRCRECVAQSWIKYRYRIEPEAFFQMVKQQKGLCAICQADLELSLESARRRKSAAIDHCHSTGAVRGLLCQPCNSGMGLLGDSVERLLAAVQYLQDFQSKQRSGPLGPLTRTSDAGTS